MADQSLEDLAQKIASLQDQITVLTRASQLANSSINEADSTISMSDIATMVPDLNAAIPGLSDLLAAAEDAITAAQADIDAAIEAAQEASDAGVAAGELASQAADDALEKAQEALDAAAAAGGGATYSGTAPTSSTPGRAGQQWFVWDSNYHVNSYYVYKDDTTKWVQTVLDDGTFGNISAGRITSGFIDAARIAAASLTAAVLAADTITSREIAADAILARNIKAAEITGDKIAARTIAAGNIVAGTITGNEIKANSITATQILANSITANELNLNTLNGKTINGVAISGGSLSTTADPNTPGSGTIQIVNSAVQARNSSSGLPHYTSLYANQNGAFSIYSAIALNASGSSLRNYTTSFAAKPTLTWVTQPEVNLSTGTLEVRGDTYALNVSVGQDTGAANPSRTARMIGSTGVFQGNDFQTPDGISIIKTTLVGTATHTASVAGVSFGSNITVNFPAGTFTKAPVVVANASNSRIMISINSVTTTSVQFGVGNWSTGTANGPITIQWQAEQPN